MLVISAVVDHAIHTIAWEDDQDWAVILVVMNPGSACLYINTRLIRGSMLGLVDVWGRRHLRMGHLFDVIWADDLDVLRG